MALENWLKSEGCDTAYGFIGYHCEDCSAVASDVWILCKKVCLYPSELVKLAWDFHSIVSALMKSRDCYLNPLILIWCKKVAYGPN